LARCFTDSPEKIASCSLRMITHIWFITAFVNVVFFDPDVSGD